MIILLASEPQTGKSTVAKKFIDRYSGDCQWVLTPELLQQGERVGFEAVSQTGERAILAHQSLVTSPVIIGSHQYHVDTSIIDRFYTKPLLAAIANPPGVFVLDEIGLIQRQSPNFTPAVAAAFAHNLNLLALISTRDKWTARYRNHPRAATLAVTPATRNQLPDLLVTMFHGLELSQRLNPTQRQALLSLTRRYARQTNLILLDKLYGHAVRYLLEARLRPSGHNQYQIQGDHGSYTAGLRPHVHCDCDLFNGRGQFANHGGDCSHVMTLRLSQL